MSSPLTPAPELPPDPGGSDANESLPRRSPPSPAAASPGVDAGPQTTPTVGARYRTAIQKRITDLGFPSDWYLIPLAAVIGTLAGVGAQVYGHMVRAGERFFFGHVAERSHIGSRWWLYMVIPASGALLVGLIKTAFKLPRISHGIPEVIEAMARRGGRMTIRSGILAAINSVLTLGSGGSTGQEGPIIHIGSVIGSTTGQWLKIGRSQMSTLVGCGAAAGLAAIFNAPIAGVLLVLEVILRDFSLRTFMPVVIASVFGVVVSQAIAGHYTGALFSLDPKLLSYHFTMREVLPYLLLGIACGPIGVGFTKMLYAMEHAWERMRLPMFLKPALGGLVLGAMGAALVFNYRGSMIPSYKAPAFMGNGYAAVETLLKPAEYRAVNDDGTPRAEQLTIAFLLLIGAGKLVGTSLTLGSGGSGGMFAPALFIGASVGGAVGILVHGLPFYGDASPALYALAGMAGVLSAAVHCPLTAIILVFEITHDYTVIMPVMLVAIAGTVVAQVLMRDSVYTLALHERGINLGTHADMTLLRRLDVASVPLEKAVTVGPNDPAQRLLDLAHDFAVTDYVVCGPDGRYHGMVMGADVGTVLMQREAVPLMIVSDLIRGDVPSVTPEETLDVALDKFAQHEVASLPVVDGEGRVLGVMTRTGLMREYQAALRGRG